jgi:hypothetical protein
MSTHSLQNDVASGDSLLPSSEEGGTYKIEDTNGDTIPPASAHARSQYMEEITVPLNNVPAFTPTKKLKVAIVGAGYSGLIMAHKLMYERIKETEMILDFTIFEAKKVPGGTWVDNTYPGGMLGCGPFEVTTMLISLAVMCDVPSAIYVCFW